MNWRDAEVEAEAEKEEAVGGLLHVQGNDLRRKVDLWRFIAYRNAYGGREDVYTFPVYTFSFTFAFITLL